MSEQTRFREPVILGLPHFENPLRDPETGQLESAFSPQPGEAVPPAKILAEAFPPRSEEGLGVPGTIEEVRLLADSMAKLHDRSPSRIQRRLAVYKYAVERQEDRLDPPLNRYMRAFKEDVTDGLEGAEGFDHLLDTLFGQPKREKLSDEAYRQWSDLFYTDPRTIALFFVFGSTAMDEGLIRKSWMRDRSDLVLPRFNTLIRQGARRSPDGAATWFIDALDNVEEVFERTGSINGNGQFAYELDDSKSDTYHLLENMAWSIFVTKYPSKTYMRDGYDYTGAHELLSRMNARLSHSTRKTEFRKFALDVSRHIGAAMIRQGAMIKFGHDAFGCAYPNTTPMKIVEAALMCEDGHTTTYEEFDAVVKERLGIDTELGDHTFRPADDIFGTSQALKRRAV